VNFDRSVIIAAGLVGLEWGGMCQILWDREANGGQRRVLSLGGRRGKQELQGIKWREGENRGRDREMWTSGEVEEGE